MPSLTPLLAGHGSLLVLDAASTDTQVGLLRAGAPAIWHQTKDEAGTGIFTGSAAVLKDAGLTLEAVGAFVFCEGPGSMLGTRTIAMALRTWMVLKLRPIYAYQSLTVAGHFERAQKAPRDFTVIADARRDTWHCQPVHADGRLSALQRVPVAEVPDGELVTPESFRAWAKPPRPAGVCSYDLGKIFPTLGAGDNLHPVDAPDAFQHAAPEYKKWSAQIHRAPAAAQP